MASRVVVVDGYNVILRVPELRPGPGRTLQASREKLVNLLGWALGSGDARVVVVFDGESGVRAPSGGGRVQVRFSRPPQKADDLIRSLVEELAESGTRASVVTSDAEVARHARAMGADVALSDLFAASLMGTPPGRGEEGEKPSRLSRKELEEWADLFRRPRDPDDEPPK